jgi:hypothetical protein
MGESEKHKCGYPDCKCPLEAHLFVVTCEGGPPAPDLPEQMAFYLCFCHQLEMINTAMDFLEMEGKTFH